VRLDPNDSQRGRSATSGFHPVIIWAFETEYSRDFTRAKAEISFCSGWRVERSAVL